MQTEIPRNGIFQRSGMHDGGDLNSISRQISSPISFNVRHKREAVVQRCSVKKVFLEISLKQRNFIQRNFIEALCLQLY